MLGGGSRYCIMPGLATALALGLGAKSPFSAVGEPKGVAAPVLPIPSPPNAVGSKRPVPGEGAPTRPFPPALPLRPPPGVLFPEFDWLDGNAELPPLDGLSRSMTLAKAELTAPAPCAGVWLGGGQSSSIMSSLSESLEPARQRLPRPLGMSSSSSSSPTISGKRPRDIRIVRRCRGVSVIDDGCELRSRCNRASERISCSRGDDSLISVASSAPGRGRPCSRPLKGLKGVGGMSSGSDMAEPEERRGWR
jgi:hypothetical protein